MKGWIIIIVAALSAAGCGIKDLKGTISKSPSQITIVNQDSYAWTNVTVTLNDEYDLTAATLDPQSTYTVGLMEFTSSDGTRFNPYTHAVKTVKIVTHKHGSDVVTGLLSGKWN